MKEITGFVKGSSWFPDYEFSGLEDPSRGAWNAVFIDGHWRFIDTRRSLSAAGFISKYFWKKFQLNLNR